MSRRLWARYGNSVRQFIKFGIVGGSGVLVNMVVAVICNKLGPHVDEIFWDLPLTEFNVRWYHVFAMVAFVVANLWNFQLNRWWTFRSHRSGSSWIREYLPFVVVGLAGQAVSFLVLTLLMKHGSPLQLPRDIFDGSSGFRDPFYWAQLVSILVAVPVTFLVNKFWTFRAVRGPREAVAAEAEVQPTARGDAE